MQPADRGRVEITRLLDATHRGEPDALDRLLEAVYPALRSIAGHLMRGERQGHTLEPTALANEAIIRLFLQSQAGFRNRTDLFAAAGRQMRRLLVDHARRRLAARLGVVKDTVQRLQAHVDSGRRQPEHSPSRIRRDGNPQLRGRAGDAGDPLRGP